MMPRFPALLSLQLRNRAVRRALLALILACGLSLGLSLAVSRHWKARATARLDSAAARLDSLTQTGTADARDRAAIAWGYSERLRFGLESPFRLVEAAARDPRLSPDERRTVALALLAHVIRGESYSIDPAALDGLGPMIGGRSVAGERHLALLGQAIATAPNPRAAELAVRFAYTLAVAERLVDASAPVLVAEASAQLADREIARREAIQVVRSARGDDPLDEVRARRARRAFYVERPALLAPTEDLEHAAIQMTPRLLDQLRAMFPSPADTTAQSDSSDASFAPRLFDAGRLQPPTSPLSVTVQRYLPMIRAQAPDANVDRLARAHNGEMLVAAARLESGATRPQRRAVARVLLAAGVAMRSAGQQGVWFVGDSAASVADVATTLGVADITFDRGIPSAWRPYFLTTLVTGVRDLRRVFPTMNLEGLHVRFREVSPADSALAMHDPRTRTLHLPVYTAAGTLAHELAHDLDRQSARAIGLAGYHSDIVARGTSRSREAENSSKVAASLRALTEELSETPRTAATTAERPAEIFATRVDWFVASALAREGISDGFLSAVEDELLTGHVVHPERLRGAGRSRSLLSALEGMTTVAPVAQAEPEMTVQTLLRWSLNSPVDRRIASEIVRGRTGAWDAPGLLGAASCDRGGGDRVDLLRLAAESRARGWLRLRARWTPDTARSPWAWSALGAPPWSPDAIAHRIAELRDFVLVTLSGDDLPVGVGAYAAPLALRARCD